MTLQDILAGAIARLDAAQLAYGHGTTNARDEAAWLVLWQLGLPLDGDLDEMAETPVSEDDALAVAELITRRIETRQPAAYLTHEAWLQGVSFYVDQRAIVPRSFIARICPQVIELGPTNATIHKVDEHVPVADIEPLKNIYRRTLERLAQQAAA